MALQVGITSCTWNKQGPAQVGTLLPALPLPCLSPQFPSPSLPISSLPWWGWLYLSEEYVKNYYRTGISLVASSSSSSGEALLCLMLPSLFIPDKLTLNKVSGSIKEIFKNTFENFKDGCF